jgi:hypothetical protein
MIDLSFSFWLSVSPHLNSVNSSLYNPDPGLCISNLYKMCRVVVFEVGVPIIKLIAQLNGNCCLAWCPNAGITAIQEFETSPQVQVCGTGDTIQIGFSHRINSGDWERIYVCTILDQLRSERIPVILVRVEEKGSDGLGKTVLSFKIATKSRITNLSVIARNGLSASPCENLTMGELEPSEARVRVRSLTPC